MSDRIEVQRLIHWLRNDRYEVDSKSRGEADLAYRRAWNQVSEHVENVIVPRVIAEQRISDCLDELQASACDEQG